MTILLRTSTHLNKSLTRLKIISHETAQEYFLSSEFDNVLGTFFVDDLYQVLSLFQNLLGLWHSYLGPQPIWTSPWQDWKSDFMKLQNCARVFFELEIWQRVKYFFRRWPISNIISVSEPTRNMTIRLRTSTHFNKSLTRLKITFHKTAQEYFLSSKFDNVLGTFFRRWPISNFISFSEPTRIMTLLLRTSTDLNRSLTRLKITFLEPAKLHKIFLSSKFDNVLSTFFVDDVYQIFSVLEPTKNMTLRLRTSTHFNKSLTKLKITFYKTAREYFLSSKFDNVLGTFFRRWPISNFISFSESTRIMALLLRTSTHLNNSLTRLKITSHETAQECFLSSKFDNVLGTFFVDDLYQIFSVLEPTKNMTLRLRTSTHFKKSLTKLKITFYKTAREYFLSSKFDNVLGTFFVDDLYQKLSLFRDLLGLWQSYLGPQPIWTIPWQDWKSVFMKLQNCTTVFFELEIWQRVKFFFRRWPISNIISVLEPTRTRTLLLRTSTYLKESLTRLKITFHKSAQEYFLSSKFDNVLSTFFVDDLYLLFRIY